MRCTRQLHFCFSPQWAIDVSFIVHKVPLRHVISFPSSISGFPCQNHSSKAYVSLTYHRPYITLATDSVTELNIFFLCLYLCLVWPLAPDHTQWKHLTHSARLLWMSDQPVAETSTWQHTTFTRDKHPCPRRDSNPQSQQASGRRPTALTDRIGC